MFRYVRLRSFKSLENVYWAQAANSSFFVVTKPDAKAQTNKMAALASAARQSSVKSVGGILFATQAVATATTTRSRQQHACT
jgi:hypothetical protein